MPYVNLLFKHFLVILLFTLVNFANAEDSANSATNNPQTPKPKVEVIEFFWYGCGICNVLEPYVNEWKKNLSDDVIFTKIPAFTGDIWDVHGKIYLTLEAMRVDPAIHSAVFDSIHNKEKILRNDKEITEFLTNNKLDVEQFFKIYNSAGIKLQIDRAKALFRSYKLTGVPAFIVAKKHNLSVENDGPEGLFKRIDKLITVELKAQQPITNKGE